MMKKIDAHLHVAEIIAGYCRRGELRAIGKGRAEWANGDVFQLIPEKYGDKNFLAETVIDIMDKNNIEKVVLMQGSMYGFQNKYHKEILEKYGDRFIPSGTVDPYATNHMEVLEYLLNVYKFKVIKFEVSSFGGLMGCHDTFRLDSERMFKIYEMINKYNAVVAFDIGDLSMESHQVDAIYNIAKAFPNLKILVCHLLAPTRDTLDKVYDELKTLKLPNIWFDLAALPKIMDVKYPYKEVISIIKDAIEILGSDRLLWGTDAPFATVRDSYENLSDYIEKSNEFTKDELENIYYNNAKRLYDN